MQSKIEQAEQLCQIAHIFSARQWCLATSGNFSFRSSDDRCVITESGKDKSRLQADDFLVCDMQGKPIDETRRPSAETALHCCLYQLDHSIGTVLHTHSPISTVFSRNADSDLYFEHYEMQKAFAGVTSHVGGVGLAILENDQDMSRVAAEVRERWHAGDITAPGFLLRGHGLYAWGTDMFEAQRHAEGLEFLLACAWQEHLAKA